ncbi:MAG TPA: trehalase-like domain-containing protein, partial [Pedobacter sp.]
MEERHTYQTGIIGNCAYLAHVNKNTNIDWLCWPRFDSTFVFGGLLDSDKGGEYSIRPSGEFESNQFYFENTNVICTEITNTEGTYRITDYAPRFYQYERYFKPLMLIRKIEPIKGNSRVRVVCTPVTDYGIEKQIAHRGSNHIEFTGADEDMQLSTNISLSYIEDGKYFALNETKYLILTYGHKLDAPIVSTAERFLTETIKYWRRWIKHSNIAGFYQPIVIRSSLVLKIHQYEDTGAIIAASTTSLPESP